MRISHRFPVVLSVLALASVLHAQAGTADDVETPASKAGRRTRVIRLSMRDGLRFSPPRFEAKPGEEIRIEIENGDTTDMLHNFLLLRPGTREEILQLATALGDQGTAKNWVPDSDAILLSTPLLEVGRRQTLEFRAPAEPGIYPYVCTFPGHGVMMFGAAYVGVKPPPLDEDKMVPPTAAQGVIAGGGRRPFAQRVFMPDAGPAAIAVALSGSQNACWDAGECRLRYVWQGTFIDASQHWAGNGRNLAQPSATPWWSAERGDFPLRFGQRTAPAPAVKFLGYAMNANGPEFHYRAGASEVFEQVLPRTGAPGITVRVRIPNAEGSVFYRAPSTATAEWTSSTGTFDGGVLTLTPAQAADFTLTLTSPLCKP